MITFRFFNQNQRDDEVATEMRTVERRFLRATDPTLKTALESQYAVLEAWFEGDTTRLNATVSRVSGR